MGDRAHLHLTRKPGEPGIWVYTHWSGSNLPNLVANALTHSRSRWRDPSYANRMVFGSLVGPEDLMQETGWGIDTEPGDEGDGNRIIWVQWSEQLVFMTKGPYTDQHGEIVMPETGWSFENFISNPPQWRVL